MKYGIAVRIVETGYVEIEADCALDGRVLFHEAEVESVKVESVFCPEHRD